MRNIIQHHNRLNGLAFSIIEFGLIGLFASTFGTYYLLHHRLAMALISWGIALNSIPVVVYGLRQLFRDRAAGIRGGSFWDKNARVQLKKENPRMLRDTLILTTVTLLPFVSFAAVVFEERFRA